jgi:hypothetical protein
MTNFEQMAVILDRNPHDKIFPLTEPKHTYGMSIDLWLVYLTARGLRATIRPYPHKIISDKGVTFETRRELVLA